MICSQPQRDAIRAAVWQQEIRLLGAQARLDALPWWRLLKRFSAMREVYHATLWLMAAREVAADFGVTD